MLKTEANPEGTPIEAFDEIRAGVAADRSQFYKDLTEPFYGANRPGA
jgi:non-heme chloroperoxidase